MPYPGDSFEISRNTKDDHTHNLFGESLVQMCCLLDIHLLNGRINGDKKGEFTCIANQGTSIVDYNIASSDLFKNISLFHVEDRDESVHYPLKCILSLPAPAQEIHLEDHACDPRIKYSWDESKIDTLKTKFRERYNSQYDRILFAINEIVEDASNMFIELLRIFMWTIWRGD